ncbi:hypothetical protein BsWGS_05707 [Bradybaena similaris]
MILSYRVIYTSPVSPANVQTLLPGPAAVDTDLHICKPVKAKLCSKMYNSTVLPSVYGDISSEEANEKVKTILSHFSQNSSVIIAFVCTLYLPPCFHNNSDFLRIEGNTVGSPPQPCRQLCQLATDEAQRLLVPGGQLWPANCRTLPTENCLNVVGDNKISLVEQTISALPSWTLQHSAREPAPIEVGLGSDEGYEFEVVTYSNTRFPQRRYDVANFGDPDLFQGWADVQGTGAANDYCRVVGKGKRRFLSCNLAGSTGQGHHYVSKLGFEPGYLHTWFMRDVDGDGRDDYCRCVGPKRHAKMTCMKAGEHGFYGSTTQGGEQHTFTLPGSEGCVGKRYNPWFGEVVA